MKLVIYLYIYIIFTELIVRKEEEEEEEEEERRKKNLLFLNGYDERV